MFKFKRIKNILVRKIKVLWDRFQGYDFHTTVKSKDLNLNPKQFFNSSPSASFELKKVFNAQKFTSKDSILDIGCGKGSILRLLLKYPFKEIGGIEISKSIYTVCFNNMKKINDIRVNLSCIDARNFEDFKKYNYYYTYNPCSKEIFEEIIKKIKETCKSKKTFIYNNPIWDDVLKKNGFVYNNKYFNEWGNDIKVYSIEPD